MYKTTRRGFMGAVGGVAAAGALARRSPAAQAEAKRPSIVFILADDLGYGDVACYGRPDVKTPAIDRLAREGIRFTQSYASAPECTPTRTALLTGRYPQRVGGLECAIGTGNVGRYDDAIRLRETHDLGLPADRPTIARLLKDAGYATGISGKWHLGYEDKFAPSLHGFDHAFYCLGGGMDYFYHTEPDGVNVLRLDGRPVRRDGYFTDLVTDDAVAFIRQHQAHPFFLYVAYTAPHAPYQGPKDRRDQPLAPDDPLMDQGKGPPGTYTAMIERMDEGIARILDAIEAAGLASDTLVIFASDNGGTRSGRNAPFSGFKGSTYEGGIRVPAVARWPGRITPGTVSEQVCVTMDFTASIARIGGARPPAAFAFDGIDILQLVEGKQPVQPRTIFWRIRRGEQTRCAVRDGAMKLIVERQGPTTLERLFNLEDDPAEQNDLSAVRPADLARLRACLAQWEAEVRPGR
jgi:N-acetylgalactosamine-6-sulfatase